MIGFKLSLRLKTITASPFRSAVIILMRSQLPSKPAINTTQQGDRCGGRQTPQPRMAALRLTKQPEVSFDKQTFISAS